ncbi:MAG: ABC transporter ATP-binding protein, partial [Flavobacteriaceae bacterium]
LTDSLDRYPRQLTGGQRQRVAMGRAIVRDPQVFLFDEPLSTLDAKLRVAMRTEIRELHQRLKSTSIYVTHDQIEAMTMADQIVVMRDGVIEQIGAPLELYDRPQNVFVAGFIGSPAMNFIDGVVERAGGAARLHVADGVALPLPEGSPVSDGQKLTYGARPEHLSLATGGEGVPARISVIEPTGAETLVVSRVAGREVTASFKDRHPLKPGETIRLKPRTETVHLFDAATGNRITA